MCQRATLHPAKAGGGTEMKQGPTFFVVVARARAIKVLCKPYRSIQNEHTIANGGSSRNTRAPGAGGCAHKSATLAKHTPNHTPHTQLASEASTTLCFRAEEGPGFAGLLRLVDVMVTARGGTWSAGIPRLLNTQATHKPSPPNTTFPDTRHRGPVAGSCHNRVRTHNCSQQARVHRPGLPTDGTGPPMLGTTSSHAHV